MRRQFAVVVTVVALNACEPMTVEPVSRNRDLQLHISAEPLPSVWAPGAGAELAVGYDAARSTADQRAEAFRRLGAIAFRYLHSLPVAFVVVPAARASEVEIDIRRESWVTTVEPLVGDDITSADTVGWNGLELQTQEAAALGYVGTGVKVLLIDSAVDCNHSDLDGQVFGGVDYTGSGGYCASGGTALGADLI